MTAAADWIARRKALADAATDGPWTWTEGTNFVRGGNAGKPARVYEWVGAR